MMASTFTVTESLVRICEEAKKDGVAEIEGRTAVQQNIKYCLPPLSPAKFPCFTAAAAAAEGKPK